MAMKLGLSCAAALALALAGCGDDGGGTDAMTIGCMNDPRAMTYTADMVLPMSTTQKLRFELVSSMPAPPMRYTNTWTLKLVDGSGQVVTGATMKVTPYMPDHGHGTSVVPQITPMGDTYVITPLYLYMPGLWQVTVEVDSSSAGADTGVFYFCIGA
jgi:YtkA-like